MAYKVVIPQDITEKGKEFLRNCGYEVVVGSGKADPETLKAEIADADAILVRLAKYPGEVLAAATKLKVIGRHGVGIDNIDMDYCRNNGIRVTFTPEANALSVAEHTIALMIAAAINLPVMHGAVVNDSWATRNKFNGIELDGKTIAVLGLGRIGRQVAEKAMAGFNMKVVGYDPFLPEDRFPASVERVNSMEEAFFKGDFVTLHMPSTAETRNMVNEKLLSVMKPGAILINCARGDLVDEDALYQALTDGTLRAAALDVFRDEPPKADNPLMKLQNVVYTPHTASLTQEALDRMGLHAAMGIHDVLCGKEPQWPAK